AVNTTSYHELHTLSDKWVVPELGKPLEIPPDLLMLNVGEVTSWYFDVATYSWGPCPNC
ncbi:hypothetical protein HAX54_008219, partial [Datura stramonium]|nr:hypothetical protein [Datura stramonium]